jgi:beta-1,4-mannosyltransferase
VIAAVRVLQSFRLGRTTTNPYLSQLVASLPAEVAWEGFSWRAALLGGYDVFHVHWPEVLLRGSSRSRTAIRGVLLFATIVRIRISHRAIVRTLHNASAHETGSRIERWLLRYLDRSTALWIRLTPSTEPPTAAPVVTILHGDYRQWFEGHHRPDPVPGRVLYFGLIRAYKGVEDLVDAFRETAQPGMSLRIVGRPQSAALADDIAVRASGDSRISHAFDYVDDAALAREVGESSLVVLPYRAMHNSGALLLALSLGRPVLVPSNDVTRSLAEEVGEGWVRVFEATISSAAIEDALTVPIPQFDPRLDARDWPSIGRAHLDAYRAAAEKAHSSNDSATP